MFLRWWFLPLFVAFSLLIAGSLLLGYAVVVAYPGLPSLDALTDYHPKIPLRVYSAEGELIGEYGEERRALVSINDVPKTLIEAILAAEDERFYQHGGVDYVGVARAALSNFIHGGARQGASTITMQVARNFFLTKEKTFTRKFNETLLAFKIEQNLSKDQILQLYINQIYLGQRAYGFEAAAQTYFGKSLTRLNVAEHAMLAGLPKAPSAYNPVSNPRRAKSRQAYVLGRMKALGFISPKQYEEALNAPLHVLKERQGYATHAEYLTEMVRQQMYDRYQDAAYTSGLRVYTTIFRKHQDAAYAAVRQGVLDYDRRHGYRGAERYVEIPAGATDDALEELLGDESDSDDILPALVLDASTRRVTLFVKGEGRVTVSGDGLSFAQRMLARNAPTDKKLRRGAVTRARKDASGHWEILQMPQVEAALVGLDPKTGDIRALVGGFDFSRSQFNHATQAYRQPGSSFKPFVYSAALEKGFTPATIINDAPLSFDASETGSTNWEPKNYDGTFDGPISLRTALTKSKNLVSIRILQAIGTDYAQDYAARFGFEKKHIPPYLTMALGAGSVTVMQMAVGYAAFANGGMLVTPNYIQRIVDVQGKVIESHEQAEQGHDPKRIIDPRNAFIMTSLMQDVVRVGTAVRAKSLGRSDLAGKTGTTNDQVDAWFAGYNPSLVAVSWVGFDAPRSLGVRETGSAAALPIWMTYMGDVLKGVPEEEVPPPEGVVAAAINPATGLRDDRAPDRVLEFFYQEALPREEDAGGVGSERRRATPDEIDDQLY
ncbi:MAG: PBP1A family penicillin-binding protein [Betaproteobacteria bacterium]|nr:PBP1A family penicillin-binding protein [Betaproteobacteria bacterium]